MPALDISKKIIRTKRLALEPMGPEHYDGIMRFTQDAEASKYMSFMYKRTEDEIRRFLYEARLEWGKERPSAYEFAVCSGGETIGEVSVYFGEDRTEGELGWFLNSGYCGKGYGYEAACALADFSRTLGFASLIAHCDTRNAASAHLMEKLGMVRESEDDRIYPDERGKAREYLYRMMI